MSTKTNSMSVESPLLAGEELLCEGNIGPKGLTPHSHIGMRCGYVGLLLGAREPRLPEEGPRGRHLWVSKAVGLSGSFQGAVK